MARWLQITMSFPEINIENVSLNGAVYRCCVHYTTGNQLHVKILLKNTKKQVEPIRVFAKNK